MQSSDSIMQSYGGKRAENNQTPKDVLELIKNGPR
jgi:hypothetical protein